MALDYSNLSPEESLEGSAENVSKNHKNFLFFIQQESRCLSVTFANVHMRKLDAFGKTVL